LQLLHNLISNANINLAPKIPQFVHSNGIIIYINLIKLFFI